jgi:hypothetical protein
MERDPHPQPNSSTLRAGERENGGAKNQLSFGFHDRKSMEGQMHPPFFSNKRCQI